MASKFYDVLSRDYSLILNDADDFNVIIQVGEYHNTKEFRAHTVTLRARSPYFKRALSNDWIVKENDVITFHKPNITPKVFEMILEYIYTGELDLTKQSSEDILGLLVASDELLLEELFKHVQDHLIEDEEQTIWIQDNLVLALNTVFKLDSCKELQDYCLEIICEDPQSLFTSQNFPSLNGDILYELLKREDLQVDEVINWAYLIKWGFKQISGLKNGSNGDKNENIKALKEILNKFIPLIRFSAISSANFFDGVRPFKAIVPNHIYEEIEAINYIDALPKTTLSPRTGALKKIESTIIKAALSSIIIKWIKRRDYKFNLIYRKSLDRLDGKNNMREILAGQGSILILVKVKDSEKIFGGYNPFGWPIITRNFYYQSLPTTKSFIFSFENNEDTKNMKISRVIDSSEAIFDCPAKLVFGRNLNLDNDYLFLADSAYYENNLNGGTYETYKVEEIEAFSVVKK